MRCVIWDVKILDVGLNECGLWISECGTTIALGIADIYISNCRLLISARPACPARPGATPRWVARQRINQVWARGVTF